MPMLLSRRTPDDIAGTDLFDRSGLLPTLTRRAIACPIWPAPITTMTSFILLSGNAVDRDRSRPWGACKRAPMEPS